VENGADISRKYFNKIARKLYYNVTILSEYIGYREHNDFVSCFRGHIQCCWPWGLLWETRRNLTFFNCSSSYLIDSELISAQYKQQFYQSDPFDEIDESSSQKNRSKMGWYDRSKLDDFLAEFFRVYSDDFPTFCEWPWTIFENKHMGKFGFLYFN